jgi:hypothetical protein
MDCIFSDFLETQNTEGMGLSDASDLMDLVALDESRFVATFKCKGLVRDAQGEIREHAHFGVGIRFPESYLRHANPAEILTWLGPEQVWHPNISAPFICIGPLAPGTPLVELLHRCFEIITGDNVTMQEHDALNHPACVWARRNRDRFPVDTRPIKRRSLPPIVELAEAQL